MELMIEAHGGNPVSRAEDALIRRLSARRGLYARRALRLHLVQFKAGLLGDDPTPIDRVLVDSIGCCYLDAGAEFEERLAEATSGKLAVMEFFEKRKDRATRRLHRALKALDLIRRKIPAAVAVQVNVVTARAAVAIDEARRRKPSKATGTGRTGGLPPPAESDQIIPMET